MTPKETDMPMLSKTEEGELQHAENRRLTFLVLLASADLSQFTALEFLIIVESLGLSDELKKFTVGNPAREERVTDVSAQLVELGLTTAQKEH